MTKSHLRKQALAARRALSPEETALKSAAIRARLAQFEPFASAATVLTYVSSKDNEVDTQVLIASLLAENRQVLVPAAMPGGELAWSRLISLEDLVPSRFGILEPQAERLESLNPPSHSVCLVPGLCFTPTGDRLGRGGGFFDRFLSIYGGCVIGLAYQAQIVDEIPVEEHDIPVRFVITDCKTYAYAENAHPPDNSP